jgi:NTE family protein
MGRPATNRSPGAVRPALTSRSGRDENPAGLPSPAIMAHQHRLPLAPLQSLAQASANPGPGDLGIVMGGGGARAAYQVGLLRCIAKRFPELHIPYITGVSAGAINAVHLASHHGTFLQAVDELTQLWSNLTIEDVFRVDSWSLARNVLGWARQLLSGGAKGADYVRGFVDTQPLREYLTDVMHAVGGECTGVRYNIERGRVRALAVSTSSYSTGESVTWVQGKNIEAWERPFRRAQMATITIEHVMASSALPLFFPAVQLQGAWYGDGGIRLTDPLSPVIHLGARRILCVSTRYDRAVEERGDPVLHGYPPPAQVIGLLTNSIFLDSIDADAHRVGLINRLVDALPEERRLGLRPVKLLVLRPSVDLGKLAAEVEPELPRAFRFMTRGLGTRAEESPEFLSLILFHPDYTRELMDIGERDAEARADEIQEFIFGSEEERRITEQAAG